MFHGALSNTKKQDPTNKQFINKMKAFVTELAAARKTADDDELKGYILNDLNIDYTPMLSHPQN
jgi:hypothetical protein